MAISPLLPVNFESLWQNSVLVNLAAHFLHGRQPAWLMVDNLGAPFYPDSRELRHWLKHHHQNDYFLTYNDILYRYSPQYPGPLVLLRHLLHPDASLMYGESDPTQMAILQQHFQADPRIEHYPGTGLQLLQELAAHHHTAPVQVLFAAHWSADIAVQEWLRYLQQLTNTPQPFCAFFSYELDNAVVDNIYQHFRKSSLHRVLAIEARDDDQSHPGVGVLIVNPPQHYEKRIRGAAAYFLKHLGKQDLADIQVFWLIDVPAPDRQSSEFQIEDHLLEKTEELIAAGHRQYAQIGQRIPEIQAGGDGQGMGLLAHPLLADQPEGVAPKLSQVAANNPQAEQEANNPEHVLKPELAQRLQNEAAPRAAPTPKFSPY